MKTNKNIPALRLKGFTGDWNHFRIDSVAKQITSGSRDWAQFYSFNGDKFIRMTNLSRTGISMILKDLKYVKLSEQGSEGIRTRLTHGDILISITAELGKIGWIPKDFGTAYINQHVALVRLIDSIDSKFVAHQLSTHKCNIKLNKLNDSGAKAGLNLSTIGAFYITAPQLPEQQKIASFLSAVDEKIQQLTRKKELLEQYKKGVMQQLFSGKLRFKDRNGKPYPKWEEKLFDECIQTISTRSHQIKSNEILEVGKYRVVDQGQSMVAGYSDRTECLFTNQPVIVFGDHTTILKYVDFDFIVGADGTKLLACSSGISLKYIYYYLSFNSPEQEGYKRHFSILREIKIKLPAKEEQQKIASFLSAIDAKLKSVSNQIDQTQTFKKGLLQQMFV